MMIWCYLYVMYGLNRLKKYEKVFLIILVRCGWSWGNIYVVWVLGLYMVN